MASAFRFGASRRGNQAALSLPELLVVVAVIGILASVAIFSVSGVSTSASQVTADKNLKDINSAVLNFNQANWELVLTADNSSSSDELEVFRSLQYRNSMSAAPGSPYISPEYSFVASSDPQTYRASWNGRMFQMIPPGTSGVGMDLLKMAHSGAGAVFTNNYRPLGAP